MSQNRNQQFLSAQPELALYLDHLKESIYSVNLKINQQKFKARQLLFNISTLFGTTASRSKVEEQMNKVGVIVPTPMISNPELDDIITKINQHIPNYVSSKVKINQQFKRPSSSTADQQGLAPKKKRKIQGENRVDYKIIALSDNQHINSENQIQKQHSQKHNQADKFQLTQLINNLRT